VKENENEKIYKLYFRPLEIVLTIKVDSDFSGGKKERKEKDKETK
jgi:hypothetical protein